MDWNFPQDSARSSTRDANNTVRVDERITIPTPRGRRHGDIYLSSETRSSQNPTIHNYTSRPARPGDK